MNNKEPKKDCPVSEYYILNNILRIIDFQKPITNLLATDQEF